MAPIEIADDEIHLWHASLTMNDDEVSALLPLLSQRDMARVDGFTDPRARKQRVISRAMLRKALAPYVGCPPEDLKFGIAGAGKPVLVAPRKMQFNQTHSGDIVLYAIAASREVGVDVERLRPVPKAVALAKRFMSAEEHERIRAASGEERDHAFLSMWVRRESSAKACGTSMWRALEGYLAAHPDHAATMSRYTAKVLDYSDEYVAAVAAVGDDWQVIRRGGVGA